MEWFRAFPGGRAGGDATDLLAARMRALASHRVRRYQLEEELSDVYASSSWRLTGPLRTLGARLRGVSKPRDADRRWKAGPVPPALLREHGGSGFDCAPFCYGVDALALWDEPYRRAAAEGPIAFFGPERIGRGLESQFGRLFRRAGGDLPVEHVIAHRSRVEIAAACARRCGAQLLVLDEEFERGFLPTRLYHPVAPQLLRETAAPLRRARVVFPAAADAASLSDLPGSCLVEQDGRQLELEVPVLDSKILPRLLGIEAPGQDIAGMLQAPGNRDATLGGIVDGWASSRQVRRRLQDTFFDWTSVVADERRELPLVTCILASKRPDFVPRAVEMLCRQGYPDIEIVLVCHGFSLGDAVPARPGLRVEVIEAPAGACLGECLNLGIAASSGAVWMKIDDDDVYGPDYIEDGVRLLFDTDADVLARPLLLTRKGARWFFDEERAARSNVYIEDVDPTGHMCGATLVARNVPGRIPGFDPDLRRGVDSEFLLRARRDGLRLVSVNVPGYACIRYSAPDHHTWSMDVASGVEVSPTAADAWIGCRTTNLSGDGRGLVENH